MKATLLTLVAMLIATIGTAQNSQKQLNIIPEPVETTITGDSCYRLTRGAVIRTEADLQFPAEYLADYADHYLGMPLQIELPQPAKRRGKATATVEPLPHGVQFVNLRNGEVSGGYRLTITKEQGVTIEGNDAAGVFYGVQTLIQLLPTQAGILPRLPEVEIEDYPRFEYRGMLLDVVRHFFPIDYIKRYIDFMALHKLNYFHWHLTDDQGWRIEMKCRPELTAIGAYREGEIEGLFPGKYYYNPYGAYYTQEQIREVIEYAAERHITVIPEIDIPGHCMAVLAVYPHFSTNPDKVEGCAPTWGIYNRRNNVLAPSDEVFDFLTDVFSELCDLFPSSYIHLGGDECAKKWWQSSPATQQFMQDHNLADEKALQSYFVHHVQRVIESKGKRAIGWDEVLEGGISKDCIIMNWRRPNFGANALQAGNRTIFACSQWSYFNVKESRMQHEIGPRGPLSLEKVYGFDPVADTLTVEQRALVWGIQGCLWTEYIPNTWKVEYNLFPRMSALAENAWSQRERKSWENFSQKIVRQFDRYELWGMRYNDAFLRQHDIVRSR